MDFIVVVTKFVFLVWNQNAVIKVKKGHGMNWKGTYSLSTSDLWHMPLPHVYEQGVDGSKEMRVREINRDNRRKNANMSWDRAEEYATEIADISIGILSALLRHN